ncbi:MAG TPA: Uma2 family endonuclease [Thermoanaerobaculia bacterium]|jgi:Uma2 family endonuclease
MAPQTSIKLTYEDYAAIPDDGRRHEIIDGEHYVNPAPNLRHQAILARLGVALCNHIWERRLGEVYFAPVDVRLIDHVVVQPDIVFVSAGSTHTLTPDYILGVPDFVVEILSSNRSYDERVKYGMYERAGVAEYWIVDPYQNEVKIFRRSGAKFVAVPVGETVTSPFFPDLTIALRDIFE